MLQRFTLGKEKKLKSRKRIEQLFSDGKSFSQYPIRVVYLEFDDLKETQVGFSVPKRKFKLAVTRNLIKRRIREAYRLHQYEFKPKSNQKIACMFLYIGKEVLDYSAIEKAMQKALEKLTTSVNSSSTLNNETK